MAKKKEVSDEDLESILENTNSLLKNLPWVKAEEDVKYFNSLKDMRLVPHAPKTILENIEEIEYPSLEILRDVDRFSTPSPDACYFWLLCEDVTETAGGSYLHLIGTIRLFRVKGVTNGILVMFQRLFSARTDLTDVSKYAPIEIYLRVVEDYYKEYGYSLKRGTSSFIFYAEGHQGAMIGWSIGVSQSLQLPAIYGLYEQMGILAEIEKRYASRMNYTDVSQLDEENPWIVIMDNLKSIDKKVEDALSKNKTTIYGDIKISKGDFVGGDKVTSIHNNTNIFTDILTKVDKKENLSKTQKNKLKSEITELESAIHSSQPNESFIKQRLQNIKKMAPDIFAVTLNTLLNPISGLSTVITKIAEKMKAGKSNS